MGRGSAVLLAAAALLLNACDRPAASTTYVSRDGSSVALLQLTQTPDHRLSGTLQTVTLDSNGVANAVSADVSGMAAGSDITLSILGTAALPGQTLHGTAANGDLDLAGFWGRRSSQAGMAHFSAGNAADFKATVAQLTRARAAQLEQTRRVRQAQVLSNDTATLPALNREAVLLSQALRAFLADARRVIALEPGVVASYRIAVADHRKKLASIHRLMAGSGTAPSARKRRRARQLFEQMQRQQRVAGGADQTLDHAQQAWREREAAENQGVARLHGHCSGAAAMPGKLMLDASLCKDLLDTVADYQAILDPLHVALAGAGEARAHGEMLLARIGHAAALALVPRPAATEAEVGEDDTEDDAVAAPLPALPVRSAAASAAGPVPVPAAPALLPAVASAPVSALTPVPAPLPAPTAAAAPVSGPAAAPTDVDIKTPTATSVNAPAEPPAEQPPAKAAPAASTADTNPRQ